MEPILKITTLFMATLLTGLSAGLCFTWTNAITPGIGRLGDIGYLQAFQQMNRTILNPKFFVVFFGPFFLLLITTFLYRASTRYIIGMLIAAFVFYFLGVVLVTIFGNVPLNEMLDKTDLSNISVEEVTSLRAKFETTWNNLHLIRTVSAAMAFSLLILTCFIHKI